MNKKFTEEELNHYYKLLDEPLTPYDCGKLCAPQNGGTPFCCIVENAVPMLYREEFKCLSKRTKLWRRWSPSHPQDKQQKAEEETEILIFCECKGIAHCERQNRSVACRTFPLEPYFNKEGEFVGLVFMREFQGKCPLTARLKDIKQSVIDNHYEFWRLIMEKKSDEYNLYKNSSRGWRISTTKRGVELPILYPSHLKKAMRSRSA